jgi:hypothetical protein
MEDIMSIGRDIVRGGAYAVGGAATLGVFGWLYNRRGRITVALGTAAGTAWHWLKGVDAQLGISATYQAAETFLAGLLSHLPVVGPQIAASQVSVIATTAAILALSLVAYREMAARFAVVPALLFTAVAGSALYGLSMI